MVYYWAHIRTWSLALYNLFLDGGGSLGSLAAGLPIVASAVGGVPEILNHGQAGVLIPPGDFPAFTRAVIDLIDHPEERSRLGLSGKKFIEEDYSLEAAVARVEQTYKEMMGACGLASS